MTEENKKAFDFASDFIKLLITLSTGIIALVITFYKDFLGESIENKSSISGWMYWMCGMFLLSIFFGILAYMNMIGTLGNDSVNVKSIYKGSIRVLTFIQIFFFLIGLMFCINIGIKSI